MRGDVIAWCVCVAALLFAWHTTQRAADRVEETIERMATQIAEAEAKARAAADAAADKLIAHNDSVAVALVRKGLAKADSIIMRSDRMTHKEKIKHHEDITRIINLPDDDRIRLLHEWITGQPAR